MDHNSDEMYIFYNVNVKMQIHKSFQLHVFSKEIISTKLRKQGLPWWLSGKESACQCKRRRSGFNPWVGEDPLEKNVATRSSILAWWATVHGVTKASDMTYRLNNNNNNKE